jgi:hypothetical protein
MRIKPMKLTVAFGGRSLSAWRSATSRGGVVLVLARLPGQ